MRLLLIVAMAVMAISTHSGVAAAQTDEPQGRVLRLADAYQNGFLQMSAVSCFSIYSSSGFVFGDFANGVIDGATAINSLEQVALLHTVCYTSISEVLELTPESDVLGIAELGAIKGILERENALLSALLDLFSEGGIQELEQVKHELRLVEQALDDYTSPSAE